MFIDTSGLFCCHHAGETQFAAALQLFKSASLRLTHSFVLAEFVPLCQTRRLKSKAALNFASDLMDNPNVDVVWVDEGLHRAAMLLLRARLDKSYSVCDAVSFLLMRQYGITEALTTNRHFEQEGFVRLLQA